jgi:cytochrome c oxidase assembly protein subunit 15
MPAIYNRAIHRFAVVTAIATLVLLTAGALVTSNNAADSVPDWPLAYGKIIPPLVGGIRFEYTHRVLAGLVAILTAILAIWLASSKSSRLARRLGWTALGLVIAQAILGGIRVLDGHPAISATAHATLAQIYFITVVALALIVGAWWQRKLPELEDAPAPRLRALAFWTTATVFVQLILGAGFRHGAWGILPHLIGACVVAVMVVWTGRVAKKRFGDVREIRRGVTLLHATFGTQILLGFAAYWAVEKAMDAAQPTLTYVILTVAHVLVGALVLAGSVLLTLTCVRLIGSDPATAALHSATHPAEGSRA